MRSVCRNAAAGRGSVLVVGGEPGVGKTALIAAAIDRAVDWRWVRATAVEAESAIPYATVQALVWALREAVPELEQGQARLLQSLLGLIPQVEASGFLVGAAVLSLFSVVAEELPLVVVVDDAQWADPASQEALCFVGRRLESERVALIAGVRDGEPCAIAKEASFARLHVAGVDRETARLLIGKAAPHPAARAVAEQLIGICAGNPLGLVELPRLLTAEELSGETPLSGSLRLGPELQRAFAARVERLEAGSRHALLLLSCLGEGEQGPLTRAIGQVGLSTEAFAQATAVGLTVEAGGTVSFSHPLMRAAVYGLAAPEERRTAHRMLAGVLEGPRRAWQLANAAAGPDEGAASALEEASMEAHLTGGVVVQAEALERAAALSPVDRDRARRLLAAAQAWRDAGRDGHAQQLLETALPLARDPLLRAEVQRLRGQLLIGHAQLEAGYDLFLAEAGRVESADPKLAARLLLDASTAAQERHDIAAAESLTERAHRLAGASGDATELAVLDSMLALRMRSGTPPGANELSLVVQAAALCEQASLRRTDLAAWIAYCLAAHERDDEARLLSDRVLAESRSVGNVWTTCFALYARSAAEHQVGQIGAARDFAVEALSLAEEIGEPWRTTEAAALVAGAEATQGRETECIRHLEAAREAYPDFGAPRTFFENRIRGVVALATGRNTDAVDHLEISWSLVGHGVARAWYHLVPLDLCEAYVRSGRRSEAEALLTLVAPAIDACHLIRPKAVVARLRGMLADASNIDTEFGAAFRLGDERSSPHEHSRTELCFGEALRLAGRTGEAVPHLEKALAGFDELGAIGWAGLTRTELEQVTGTAQPLASRLTDELTEKEVQIARRAATGMRDREIAAALYLSSRTVEWHLRQVYRKLGLANRTQLAAALHSDGILAADGASPVRIP